jgi:spore coat-associated protein N
MTATPQTASVQPSRRRRILLPLGAMLVAAAIAMASGAAFTTSTVNASNIYATGTLEQVNDSDTIFVGRNLKPGDTVYGTVTITNSGTLDARHSLTETVQSNGFTGGLLRVKVTDQTASQVVYDGPVGQLGTQQLGTWDDGEARTFLFEATLPASATNAEQGEEASITYTWGSTQTDGERIAG